MANKMSFWEVQVFLCALWILTHYTNNKATHNFSNVFITLIFENL